jgi:cytochrome c oxidase subunit 2
MARKLATLAVASACVALLTASAALAGNGGLGPPEPATSSGESIRTIYWVVFAICSLVFVLVETTLILFVFRFRRRQGTPEHAEGPQIRGNTRVEVVWTVIPALILVGIAVFVFVKTPAVQATPSRAEASEVLQVRVEAHQFYWQYVYPNGVISLDLLRLPVDRPVALELVSFDVNHSWWVPELTGKLDAIPGRTNVLHFRPKRLGMFEGECAEFCGLFHPLMKTRVQVDKQEAFDAWLSGEEASQSGGRSVEVGSATWEAACAKCHGLQGQGGYGPPIAGNATLTEPRALTELVQSGQDTSGFDGYMPPVGLGWSDRQIDALIEYVKSNETLAGPSGG